MTTAGDLDRRITFQARELLPGGDGAGNFETDWVSKLTVWAQVVPRFGGETVIASRLEGVQPVTIIIRYSPAARQITAAWRAADAREGTIYALSSPAMDPTGQRAFLEMLATQDGAA
ncbi:phage head closure protein [Xanthobacter variabilis]|uniref:phage head closure protein n=1 Tax=Xanthobacter variabilis TaxID=3119932 RepID=UPI00374F666E